MASESPPMEVKIRLSANAARLMRSRAPAILYEGPARTGKSFTLVTYARLLCEWFPGVKILFVRQTRKSLNHSILTLWEDVLGPDHPAIKPPKTTRNRDEYCFPYAEQEIDGAQYRGVSEVHLIGMDNPERLMSTEYDVIFVFEATELTLRAWSLAQSRLSRGHLPWNFMVADCNPASATHWLNLMADERAMIGDAETDRPKMLRIRTKLQDNPKFWDASRGAWTPQGNAYNRVLDNLPPVERARLRDGLWVSQSGQVYANWDPDKHVVQGKLELRDVHGTKRWWLTALDLQGLERVFADRRVAWFGIAVDWGYLPDPGSAALYAFDDRGRAFVCEEWHVTKKGLDWWAQKILWWQKKYDVRAIVCDTPQEKVDALNVMLHGKLNSQGDPIAQVAKKGPGSIMAGIDIVRFALDDDEEGEPRLRYLATASQMEDPYLREVMAPTGGVKEYPGYIYAPREDGRPNKELPVDRNNHALDRDRYMATYAWGNAHKARVEPAEPPTPLDIDIEFDLAQLRRDQRQKSRRPRV